MFAKTAKSLMVVLSLCLVCGSAWSDAPLKSKLDLDTDQARQVQTIQKKYRKSFRSKRQVLHRENRKLRRARSDNDSQAIAALEPVVSQLQGELESIRQSENDEIRTVLTPEQNAKFDQVLQQRRVTVGSSRDSKDF